MKKLAAILLLGVLIFNCAGYRLLLSFMDKQATVRLEQRLDAGDYDESQLVEVKIPLNLPYHNNWSEYETFYGQVNYDGKYFQYVKRKVSNDTLYLLCLPHDEKTRINTARVDLFKSMNDLPVDGNNNSPRATFLKLLLNEFLQTQDFCHNQNENSDRTLTANHYISHKTQFDPITPSQPPEA